MSWFHWKQRTATEFAVSQTIRLSRGAHDAAGMLSEIHAKTVQHCQAEDCLVIHMD